MPHGYCTGCEARVTVSDGRCLLGHDIDPTTVSSRRGRRAKTDHETHVRARARAPRRTRPAAPDLADTERRPDPATRHRPAAEPVPAAVTTGQNPVIESSHNGRPRASTGLLEVNPTTETVLRLWDVEDGVAPLEEWEPEPFQEAPKRIPAQWITATLIVFGLVALWLAASQLIARQDARAAAIHRDTLELADVIDSVSVSEAGERLDDIDVYARLVFDQAEEMDVGEPDRALAIDAAGRALDLERVVGAAVAYQDALEAVLPRPNLPTAAESEQADGAAERLVMWSTGVLDGLSSAPGPPEFADHRLQTAAFHDELSAIQAAYLDGLRVGDGAASSDALIRLDAATEALAGGVIPAVDATIDQAAGVAAEIRSLAAAMSSAQSNRAAPS